MTDQLSRKSGLVARVQEATLVVAPHDLRPVVKSWVQVLWELEWFREEKGRDLFALHPTVRCPRILDLLPRCNASLLSRLRTGHIMLNNKACELGLVPSPGCACGAARETVMHFLLCCPRFPVQRARLRNDIGEERSMISLL